MSGDQDDKHDDDRPDSPPSKTGKRAEAGPSARPTMSLRRIPRQTDDDDTVQQQPKDQAKTTQQPAVKRKADDPTVRGSVEDLIMPPMESGKAYVIVIRGRSVGRMLELETPEAVLGRAQDATLPVDDDGASRRHATIERRHDGFTITDLDSTNGLYVNGVRVRTHSLKHGDRIQIGNSTALKFCFQDHVEEAYQKTLYDAATRDPLVGIYNRRYFMDTLDGEFAHSDRRDIPMSLLMLDLDHFKSVNDTHGHLAGDKALREVARVLQAALRAGDTLARYGGEEFAIILRHNPVAGALVLAERLRRAVANHDIEYADEVFSVTVSIGVATLEKHNYADHMAMLRAADAALYEAKAQGRNRVVKSEPDDAAS